MKNRFSRKGEEIVQKNYEAFNKGCEVADNIIADKGLEIKIKPNQKIAKEMMVNGASIVGMGGKAVNIINKEI